MPGVYGAYTGAVSCVSTIFGLIKCPTSAKLMRRKILILPVSVSTSISIPAPAAEICRPVLSEASDLWVRCEPDYRSGFKEHVEQHLKSGLRSNRQGQCVPRLRKDYNAHGHKNSFDP